MLDKLYTTRPKSNGFTLIELSIVLVIIGLIVGGVLVGKDLVEISKARSVINDLEQFQVATTTFKLKYNCLPGDCMDADKFGLPENNHAGLAPNGNKQIDAVSTSGDAGRMHGEENMFFSQLSSAGFIKQDVRVITQQGHIDVPNDDTYEVVARHNPIVSSHPSQFYYIASNNGVTHIRSGLTATSYQTRPAWGVNGVLSATKARYILGKINGNSAIIAGSNGSPPTSQKASIGSLNMFNNWTKWYLVPTTANNLGVAPCAVDNAGTLEWNNNNTSGCSVFWKLQ